MSLIQSHSDIDKINNILTNILGSQCKEVTFAYGGELYLDIGGELAPIKNDLQIYSNGWMISTRGTRWKMSNLDSQVITSNASSEDIIRAVSQLRGCHLTEAYTRFEDISLHLGFDSVWRFTILPTVEDDAYALAYWQVYTPNNFILEVGPKRIWRYIPIVKS